MRRCALIFTTLLLAGCASTDAPTRPVFAPDPWNEVTRLERGAEVVVIIECRGPTGPHVDWPSAGNCPPQGAVVAEDGHRVEGRLAEATRESILVRPEPSDATIFVARADIARILLVERESRWVHTLIGGAAGMAVCIFGGLYRVPDGTANRVAWSLICAGGGAGIGYLANVDPETLRLVYERPETPG